MLEQLRLRVTPYVLLWAWETVFSLIKSFITFEPPTFLTLFVKRRKSSLSSTLIIFHSSWNGKRNEAFHIFVNSIHFALLWLFNEMISLR